MVIYFRETSNGELHMGHGAWCTVHSTWWKVHDAEYMNHGEFGMG